ncbi:hypothetical protein JL721_10200 [Aureococcus anophagefferens]|nr:hypothetical protein JL721_10200 [Aureococcus anophagefferens]
MFSRDSRRRNKEAFLQKIGAHAKGDDERFLRKVQQHGDLEQRVYDAQRAVYDYSCAVHARVAAGCRVAAALEALGDTSDDAATHRELAAYRRGRNATAVDLVTKRRDCRLDRDSFATRKLDDRLDEANCKLDGLTGACEAEFDAFRGRVGAAVTRVLGALGGVECAWACGVAGPATAACEDVADRGSPALKTFSSAALARAAAHRRDLARARDAEATRLAEETAAAAEAAGLEAAAAAAPRARDAASASPRRRDSVKMPTGRAEAPPLPTGDRPAPRLPARPTPAEPPVEIVSALHAYAGQPSGDLSFAAGDRITVVSKKADGWWIGFVDDPSAKGEFPSNYVAPPPPP